MIPPDIEAVSSSPIAWWPCAMKKSSTSKSAAARENGRKGGKTEIGFGGVRSRLPSFFGQGFKFELLFEVCYAMKHTCFIALH